MADTIEFDKQLTELAFRLSGNDRFTILEAASRLRRVEEFRTRMKGQLDYL